LGANIDVAFFENAHLEAVGPVILGESVWELYAGDRIDDWDELKKAVEKRFGLS
jgi:hypothetical protein